VQPTLKSLTSCSLDAIDDASVVAASHSGLDKIAVLLSDDALTQQQLLEALHPWAAARVQQLAARLATGWRLAPPGAPPAILVLLDENPNTCLFNTAGKYVRSELAARYAKIRCSSRALSPHLPSSLLVSLARHSLALLCAGAQVSYVRSCVQVLDARPRP